MGHVWNTETGVLILNDGIIRGGLHSIGSKIESTAALAKMAELVRWNLGTNWIDRMDNDEIGSLIDNLERAKLHIDCAMITLTGSQMRGSNHD